MIAQPLARPLAGPLARSIGGAGLGFTYPKDGLILDLGKFDYTFVEVPDKSPEDNDAILYSGRAVHTDGVNDKGISRSFTESDFGFVRSKSWTIRGKVRVASAGSQYVSLGVRGGLIPLLPLGFDMDIQDVGIWVDFEETSAVGVGWYPTALIVGYHDAQTGGEFFSEADWADVELVNDDTGEVVAHYFCNTHEDVTVDGLNGLIEIDRSGNGLHGAHVGCTAIIQEGIPAEVTGLGAYEDKMWFDGVDDGIRGVNYTFADGEMIATDFIYDGGFKWLFDLEESNAAIYVNTGGSYDVRIRSGGINYNYGDGDSFSPSFSDLSTLSISRAGNDYTVTANGESLGTQTIPTSFKILGIGGGSFPFHGVYAVTHLGSITWDGTTADAVAKGWTIDGNPATVGQLRTAPPQVLGMDYNYEYPLDWQVISQAGTYDWTSFVATADGFVATSDGTSRAQSEDFYADLLGAAEYQLTFDYDNQSGGVVQVGDYPVSNGGGPWGAGGANSFTFLTGVGSFSETLAVGSDTVKRLRFIASSTGGPVTVSNLKVRVLGTLIPESFTKGIDAFGNAIKNPRTSKAFNTDESGHAQVPSSSSLDVTTEATWVLRGNFYGTVSNTVRLVSRDFDGNRCWSFGKFTNTSADRIAIELFSGNGASTSNITGLTDKISDLIVTFNNGTLRAWWDGVEISVGGTPPSVIDADPAPIRILTRQAGEEWPASFGALELFKLYDRALTDEEIQNAIWK